MNSIRIQHDALRVWNCNNGFIDIIITRQISKILYNVHNVLYNQINIMLNLNFSIIKGRKYSNHYIMYKAISTSFAIITPGISIYLPDLYKYFLQTSKLKPVRQIIFYWILWLYCVSNILTLSFYPNLMPSKLLQPLGKYIGNCGDF